MTAYILTETAEAELREILEFVSQREGKGRALHVLENFLHAFESLSSSPGMGFHRKQLTGTDTRWWPVFRFLVLYNPQPKPMTVMRILHGSRDLEHIFSPDN